MNLGSVCQTTAKGPEHVAMVLLRCTVELHLVFLGLSRWLGPEQVLIFLYQPLHTCLVSRELPIPEQALFCTFLLICATHSTPFWLTLAWRSPGSYVQEELHWTQRGGTSACERISRISAGMGTLATWAVCLMSQVHWLFIFFHRLPW